MTDSPPPELDPRRARLTHLEELAEQGGGAERVARQHESGKLTARERLALLFDKGSFCEVDKFVTHRATDFGMGERKIPGDGVVTGHGTIDGRQAFAYAQDFTVFGGSLSGAHAQKICKVMDLAQSVGAPIIGLNDSGGARIQEGVESIAGYADIFLRNTALSGVVPQLSLILGPCAGGAVYSPAITDFIVMTQSAACLFANGPETIKHAAHEEVTREALGGAQAHAQKSGVAHFAVATEQIAIALTRELLSYLPSNHTQSPPVAPTGDDPYRIERTLETVIPASPDKPYDIREVLRAVVDGRRFLEVQEGFARNVVIGLARLNGRPVGLVANQPAVLGGALDIDGSTKAARFVRFCDCFNLPLVTFVDVPGFLASTQQEWGGIIRHGAKLLYAFAEATVPKVTVVVRKAYGGAYGIMASKHLKSDINYAYPSAEIAVMNPDGAVSIIHHRELAAAEHSAAERERLASDYRERFANPFRAAELGYIDEVIRPEQTRAKLVRALEMLRNKRVEGPVRKHGNIPL